MYFEESFVTLADQIEHQKKLTKSAKLNRSSGSKELRHSLDASVVSAKLAASQKLLNVKGYVGQLCERWTLNDSIIAVRKSLVVETSDESDSDSDSEQVENAFEPDADFDSVYGPCDMRCLALVAENNMEAALKDFVLTHKNLLKKFRLTGTEMTMMMLKEVYGDDSSVIYGPVCMEARCGGYIQLATLISANQVGAMVFFQDPLSASSDNRDVEFMNRQAWKHNVLYMNNPASAHAGVFTLRSALTQARCDLIPSFFFSLESPAVKVCRKRMTSTNEEQDLMIMQ